MGLTDDGETTRLREENALLRLENARLREFVRDSLSLGVKAAEVFPLIEKAWRGFNKPAACQREEDSCSER